MVIIKIYVEIDFQFLKSRNAICIP